MKLLFVTTSIPFPPRQGIELPNAHIAEALSKIFDVDLLVITRSAQDKNLLEERRGNLPSTVGKLLHLQSRPSSSSSRLLKELALQEPTFFIDGFEVQALKNLFQKQSYDAVWFSPVGSLGLLSACRKLGLTIAPVVGLGCNDVITTTYLDSLKELLSGRMGFSHQRLIQGLRSAVIWPLEKRYLKSVDLLHVQTPLEKQRADWLLGRQSTQPLVLAAQNGRKRLLEQVDYQTDRPKRVLYMTHLSGGRASESRWFLQSVWPKIVQQHPDAKLLLVGTPPAPGSEIARNIPVNTEVLGYVEDLVELYRSVSLAVVPIIHSTGLINRALDALTAGIPLVATSAVLSTVAGCQPGKHAIAADSANDFAAAVNGLLQEPEQRKMYAASSRALAMEQPTWQDSTDAIIATLQKLVPTSTPIQETQRS